MCSKSASEGTPGNGDGTQGSCNDSKVFCSNSICSEKCSKSTPGTPGDGDGSSKGNCPGNNDICKSDGCCEGIYFYKKRLNISVIVI